MVLMVFGLFVAMRIYNLDKHIFLYRITALAAFCCSGVAFVEYELSRQTDYTAALLLSSVHTVLNSITIFIAVMSVWTFTRPLPPEKYPYAEKALMVGNLLLILPVWIAEMAGNHVVESLSRWHGIWQYELDNERFIVKLFVIWYAFQAAVPTFVLWRFYLSSQFRAMRIWALRALVVGTMLFSFMFFVYALNDSEISKGVYLCSPAILVCIVFFAYTYTNHKLFTVQPINAFDNILASMSNIMAITDLDFKIKFINEVAIKEFDKMGEDPLDRLTFGDIARIFNVTEWAEHSVQIRQLGRGQRITKEYELRFGDRSFFFQMTFSPVYNDSNINTGYLVMATNITRLKESEAKLLQSNRELQRFAYIASHDLKTPLRNITSFLSLIQRHIQKKYEDPELQEFLRYAVTGARQMNQLIVDVLEFSKLGSDQPGLEQMVNLNEIIREVRQSLNPIFQEKNVRLSLDKLPEIPADPSRMKQLFQNLIENGIKYNNSENPTIAIQYFDQNDAHVIMVKDNGIGIDETYSEKIFEMFLRLHDSSEYEGSGIGLAICKKIVEQHGGYISLKSKEGKGSRFIVSLPKGPVKKPAVASVS